MVETAIRTGALEALSAGAPVIAAASLTACPPASRFNFRGRPEAFGPAGEAFGVALPQMACRAASAGSRHALWLGPDEWLLIAGDGEAADIAAKMESALASTPHSLVEVSHRNTALEVEGSHAADVLNSGCALDLSLKGFPVGMCTRTLFHKAEIVLWRIAENRFRLEVWRSFAAYVWAQLEEARREYGTT